MPNAYLVPHRQLSASVIIPAKNEARHLIAALDALRRQVNLSGKPLRAEEYEVILLINNSTDDSFAVADRYRQEHPRFRLLVMHLEFGPESAHIGNVRRVLMDEACARLQSAGKSQGLILSTDADTEVDTDWIARNRLEIERGADAVGGRILLRASEREHLDERTREIQFLDEQYGLLAAWLEDRCDPQAHDPWPRHHQHFGGSLAVTASVYERVGGLPPERTLEDVAFYNLLVRNDMRFRHSPEVRVCTSPRLRGRTEVGLAEQLTRWSENGKSAPEILVPSVDFLRTLFRLRRDFRRLWSGEVTDRRQFAAASGISESAVRAALESKTMGAALESLRLSEVLPPRNEPLQAVVAELRDEFAASNPAFEEALFGTSFLDGSKCSATGAD